MPIWLRKFTFKELSDFFEAERKAHEKASGRQNTTVVDSSGKVNPKNIPANTQPQPRKTSYK